ncbi:MAG: cytochrome P450 [Myxococcales bacterium]|nr:cytochrome P450 [Myxococcales bacterium]
MTKSVPKLTGLPVIGNLLDFSADRLSLLQRVYRELGEVGHVSVLSRQIYIATSPDFAQSVLKTHYKKFKKFEALAKFARPITGNGLLSSEGDLHRRQRRLIAPGLSRRRIASYVDIMARYADEAIGVWQRKGQIDVLTDTNRLTMAIAASSMFSSNADTYAKLASHAVDEGTRYLSQEFSRPVHFPYEWPTPRNNRLRRAIGPLDDVIYGMIRQRRESGERPDDILSMLLNAQDEDDGKGMSDEQIRDEVITLFVAGHETTANALSWALWLLSNNPKIGDTLAEEARSVLDGRPPTFDDLEHLPLARQAFLETMRLFPPAYMVGRETLEDVDIEGWHIPKGAMVLLNIYGQHHRADFFEDPERFEPGRFEGEWEKELPKGAYMPFADGPRVCIGNHFAMMEGLVVLAHLAQRLRVGEATCSSIEPLARVTLRPKSPFKVMISTR